MTWMEVLKLALQLLTIPVLMAVARVLSRLNDLGVQQVLQDEKLKTMKEEIGAHRTEFHEHERDDRSSFSGVHLRLTALSENMAGALAILGVKARQGMKEEETK